MGSSSNIDGNITIPVSRVPALGRALKEQWTALGIWANVPDTDDPHAIITAAIDECFKDEFGYNDDIHGADHDDISEWTFGGEASDSTAQEKVLALFSEHGATGAVEFDSADGTFQTTLTGTAALSHANAQTVYPDADDYTPLLNKAQTGALDAALAILLNPDKTGDYDALRAATTDLVIALRNAPLIDADDSPEPAGA